MWDCNQACTGLGFVAGPTIYVVLNKWFGFTTKEVLQRAAILPAMALVYALIFVKVSLDQCPSAYTLLKPRARSPATCPCTYDI